MAKYLVDSFTNLVKSGHTPPLDFSISGHYVFDVPDALGVIPESTSVASLEASKMGAFLAAHPSLPNYSNDEYISSLRVDPAESTRFLQGDKKRTTIFPNGGQLTTNPLVMSGTITTVFIHLNAFTLYSEPATPPISGGAPVPNRLLYNYDPILTNFFDFDPSDITIEIRDSANTTTLATITPDTEQAFVSAAANLRLRFTNTNLNRSYYISDWVFMFN